MQSDAPAAAHDAAGAEAEVLTASAILSTLSATDAKPDATKRALAGLAAEIKARTEHVLEADAFISQMLDDVRLPVVDVRSPSEFAQGHIRGAHNLPLFSDHERSVVGTMYKHQGREAAMAQGMRYVAPKLPALVAQARTLAVDGALGVHCWRGGMRSGALSWLLRQHGLRAPTLSGGYKGFRAWALARWGGLAMPVPTAKQKKQKKPPPPVGARGVDSARCGDGGTNDREGEGAAPTAAPAASEAAAVALAAERTIGGVPAALVEAVRALPGRRVCVIGGRTGVGKTRVLHALRAMGEAVIDLEGLAGHRGSAFGWVGQRWHGRAVSEAPDQPTTEQFANDLALAWRDAQRPRAAEAGGGGGEGCVGGEGGGSGEGGGGDGDGGWLFLEDEDTHIGGVTLPAGVYAALRCAPLVIRVGLGESARVALLTEDYASAEARGADEAAWLARMLDSVSRLGKRLGGAAVAEIQAELKAGEYAAVACVPRAVEGCDPLCAPPMPLPCTHLLHTPLPHTPLSRTRAGAGW